MLVFVAAALFALTPPLTGVAIILLTAYPPRTRSTLALGMMVLLAALGLAILGSAEALIQGRQPFFPYLLITALPALIVTRVIQLELAYHKRYLGYFWDKT